MFVNDLHVRAALMPVLKECAIAGAVASEVELGSVTVSKGRVSVIITFTQ